MEKVALCDAWTELKNQEWLLVNTTNTTNHVVQMWSTYLDHEHQFIYTHGLWFFLSGKMGVNIIFEFTSWPKKGKTVLKFYRKGTTHNTIISELLNSSVLTDIETLPFGTFYQKCIAYTFVIPKFSYMKVSLRGRDYVHVGQCSTPYWNTCQMGTVNKTQHIQYELWRISNR